MANIKPSLNDKNWWIPAMKIFSKFSGWIVFPILIAVFVGQWLDRKFSSEPWFLLITVVLAFLVSMVGLVREASREYKKIDSEKLAKKSAEK
jgi:F0F1-type ATP synthase assembly protein I